MPRVMYRCHSIALSLRGGVPPSSSSLSLVVYYHYLYLIVDKTSPREYQSKTHLGDFLNRGIFGGISRKTGPTGTIEHHVSKKWLGW